MTGSSYFSFTDFKSQGIILAVLGLVFYFNSCFNEFALDDGIVIIKNEYVQQGIAGLPKIFTKDAYDSFYRSMNAQDQLSGGRYRPLSIATFAIEQEFLGTRVKNKANCWDRNGNGKMDPEEDVNGDGLWNEYDCGVRGMQLRHVINVLLYIVSGLILLWFLREVVFVKNHEIAFLAALLFMAHPIHTEVVANVKSRDEIMSLMFICLTFIYAFKYKVAKGGQLKHLGLGMVCYFLALLSKEYAITLIALLPLGFYLFRNHTGLNAVKATLPYGLVLVIYLMIRFSCVVLAAKAPDNEVLNNPYLFAHGNQKLATEIATTFNYFKLLVFPHPLSSDYSYNSIPYKDFTHPMVWISLVFHLFLVVAFIKLLQQRHLLAFAIAIYLANLFMVCNIFLSIGATMGERLIYHSSLGFVMALAYLLFKGLDFIPQPRFRKGVLFLFLAVVGIGAAAKTIERNAEWKNDITLFTKDVKTVPESVLANGNAGARYIDLSELPENSTKEKEFIYKAISYLDKAISLHPRYVTAYINRGLCYYKLHDVDKAKENWDMVSRYYPHYPDIPRYKSALINAYMSNGFEYSKEKKFDEALQQIRKALQIDTLNADVWYNLGGAYYTMQDYPNASSSWVRALQLNPQHVQAQQGFAAVQTILKKNNNLK